MSTSEANPETGIAQVEEKLLPEPPLDLKKLQLRRSSVKVVRESQRHKLKGPLRAARLCVLSILIPGLLVAIPLYMRFHVYREQMYPVGMSDMRLLDNRVSTTWCQGQLVRANTTFNAFLMPEQPVMEQEPLRVSMSRHLELEDDMKEYWAFYLLQGSSVTVSTCVRWPGASLVVIRGHKHLHQCAYIGDDSSEELEEMEANVAEAGQWPVVSVHDPNHIRMRNNQQETGTSGSTNELNQPNRMRRVSSGVLLHGNQNPINSHEKLPYNEDNESDYVDHIMIQLLQNIGRVKAKIKGKDVTPTERVMVATESSISETKENTNKEDKSATSSEVFEDVLRRLQKLGNRGRSVLDKLNKQLGEGDIDKQEHNGSVDFNTLRSLIRDMLHEENGNATYKSKRGISISTPSLQESLNVHDEDKDAAVEEGFEPDGIANHHEIVNETTLNDKSHSEFWSSFSSSEEKLLNCAGLILNLPLTPHTQCSKHSSDGDYAAAAFANTLTYKIPSNGYYFFVFGSENEVQTNYIRVHFDLEKIIYNVSNSVAACTNSTQQCSLPLDFFSNEKVVLELPVRSNDSLWNEEYIAVSTCEPRTALYLGCVVAVPLFILLFAFQ